MVFFDGNRPLLDWLDYTAFRQGIAKGPLARHCDHKLGRPVTPSSPMATELLRRRELTRRANGGHLGRAV
jgi:hypothetical protein